MSSRMRIIVYAARSYLPLASHSEVGVCGVDSGS